MRRPACTGGLINIMNLSYLITALLLTGSALLAKDYAVDDTATITGTLSASKAGDIYITTNDTVTGKGNGVSLSKEPVRNCIVDLDAIMPLDRQKARMEELKKLAATGKPVTLHGAFHAFSLRAAVEAHHCKAFFELSE
jgi:hypothetical protein